MSKLFDRLVHFDWLIFSITVTLSLLGILTIYSATRMPEYEKTVTYATNVDELNNPNPYLSYQQTKEQNSNQETNAYLKAKVTIRLDLYQKQIIWFFCGIVVFFGILFIDYQWFKRFSYGLYIFSLLLLILVLFIGKKTMGASRWINLGAISFQPTDFFKLTFLFALSAYFVDLKGSKIVETSKSFGGESNGFGGESNSSGLTARTILKSFFLFVFLPVLLIFKQPDLGSAAIIFITFLFMVLLYGAESRVIKMAIIIGLISLPFLWPLFWENLKDYQKNRIQAFLSEEVDPAGIGYHIKQSKIAIGSGGFSGKGYLKGTQGPLRFLPERHTDFIFASFTEEWGFLGGLIVISLYILYLLRGFETTAKARDDFGRYLAFGITILTGIYIFINLGMAMGLAPVVGVPLPFMSYGGSALVSNFAMAGILANIRMRRFEIFY
jgi:rod shape determining protein RodA